MQLQITLDGNEGPEIAARVIAAVEALYDMTSTVSLRIGGDLTSTLAAIGANVAAPAADAPTPDAAAVGFGTGASGAVDPPQPVTPTPASLAGVDVDVTGLPHDPRIHSGAATKNKDGRWKAKKGVQDALVATVEAELRALMAIPAGNVAAVVPPPPVVVPPPPAATDAGVVVPPPPATPDTVPTPPPAPSATAEPETFAQLMGWIGPKMSSKKLDIATVSATIANLGIVDGSGIGQLSLLAARPDLVPGAYAALKAAAGE